MSEYLEKKTVFNHTKLIPGHAVQITIPPMDPGDWSRTKDCLITEVTPFSIKVAMVGIKGEIKTEEFYAEQFEEGQYRSAYKIRNPFDESVSLLSALREITQLEGSFSSAEKMKEIALAAVEEHDKKRA